MKENEVNEVNVTFDVTIAKTKFGNYETRGEAELSFDIELDALLEVNYSSLLERLTRVALKSYFEKNKE